mgnify:CR=1 FL=1
MNAINPSRLKPAPGKKAAGADKRNVRLSMEPDTEVPDINAELAAAGEALQQAEAGHIEAGDAEAAGTGKPAAKGQPERGTPQARTEQPGAEQGGKTQATQNGPTQNGPTQNGSAQNGSAQNGPARHRAGAAASVVPPQLAATEVLLSVEVGSHLLPLRDLLDVEAGQLFTLDRMTNEPVTVLVNGRPFATGEIVAIGDHFGVRLLDILSGESAC